MSGKRFHSSKKILVVSSPGAIPTAGKLLEPKILAKPLYLPPPKIDLPPLRLKNSKIVPS